MPTLDEEIRHSRNEDDKDEEEKQRKTEQIGVENKHNPTTRKDFETTEMKIYPFAEDKDEEDKQSKTEEIRVENDQRYSPSVRKKNETAEIKENEALNLTSEAKDVDIMHGTIDRNHDPTMRKVFETAEMKINPFVEDRDEEEKQRKTGWRMSRVIIHMKGRSMKLQI